MNLWALLFGTVSAIDIVKEPSKMTNMINNERSKRDLEPITFNWDLKHELDSFNWVLKETNNTRWFYLDGNQSIVYEHPGIRNVTNKLNGAFLMSNEKFKKWGSLGWTYLFRDSFNQDFSRIIKMRLDQRNCVDIKRCSNSSFNYYTSCCKLCVLQDRKLCSYANSYYPWMLTGSLKEISYVRLGTFARYTPIGLRDTQFDSAWVFGRFEKKPETDNFLTN